MSDRSHERLGREDQAHHAKRVADIEALREALSVVGDRTDCSEQMLFSYWGKGNCWEFSDDDGLTWHHLVEGNPGDGALASRLRAVLSGRSDSEAWEDADGSSLVICEAEIGVVSRHVSEKYMLTLLTSVSGSDAMASEVHGCPDALGEATFSAARGEGTEIGHAGTVIALGAAPYIGTAASAGGDLNFVSDGLLHAVWHWEGDPAYRAVPILLAQLSDGRWRAKPVGEPTMATDPDDDIRLDLEAEFEWFDFPDDDQLAAVMDNFLYWRNTDDVEDRDCDNDEWTDSEELDNAAASGNNDPGESDALSSDWRALMQTRANVVSVRGDMRDGSSPTGSETDQRALRSLDNLLTASAGMPLDELCDGLAELAVRLNGPLLGVGCNPHARLRETAADLLDRMEIACLVCLAALAASSLVPADASDTTPGSATELRDNLMAVVSDAARSDAGRFGPDFTRWQQSAENLRRDLHKRRDGGSRKRRTGRGSGRTVALARKLLTKSEDMLGPASSLIPAPLRNPTPEESGFAILRQERGWRQTPTGRWRLGDDVRMPRLMAGSDNTSAPPVLVLMPPIEGPLVETWQVPPHWEEEMLSHGAESVLTTPVGDAYSTCPECLCPLPERTGMQTCPSCDHQVDTFTMPQTVKTLDAATARFETEEDAALAAVAAAGPFRAWLVGLSAQLG